MQEKNKKKNNFLYFIFNNIRHSMAVPAASCVNWHAEQVVNLVGKASDHCR